MKTGKEVSEAAGNAVELIRQKCIDPKTPFLPNECARIIQQAIDAQLANARNDALEEACIAIDVRMKLNIQDLTQAQIDSGNYPETALILQELIHAAAAIRALKKGPNHV